MVRMLITLCYVYLWVRFHKCYSVLIRKRLLRLNSSSSLSFSLRFDSPPAPVTGRAAAARLPSEEDVFLQLGNKSVNVTKLQVYDDLSKWTVLLGSSVVCVPRIEYISFIIEADGQKDCYHASQVSNKKVLKWSDCCLPLARCPGRPFRAVARASLEDFSRLAVAFIEDRLQLDKGLVPSKIMPVLLQDSTLTELLEKQLPHNPSPLKSLQLCGSRIEKAQSHSCSPLLTPKAKRRFEQRRGSEPIHRTQDVGSAVSDSKDHADGHGHHLHLSHCNECLELENSTILSVKYASAENIPDLPDDDSICLDNGEDTLGEVGHQSKKLSNNVPNVLVYTGGCQKRFTAVCHVLTECLNLDNYIIYPLQPQQCLTDPWLDSTRLLVLAEEHALTPQLQTRILSYLNQGGKVLGLCSSLCPAGLLLEARDGLCGQVRRLSFTKEDSTEMELSVVASGKVFVRHVQGGGEVELWGELKGDVIPHQRDMVIVRVTHGEDGGEAVICQVHLENAPESSGELKVSSALRHEVLVEILTSLGLSCQQNQTPALSPVYLLATSQEVKTSFASWLRTRADTNGLVALSKVSLRMASGSETHGGSPLPDGSLTLFTDFPEPQKWDQFSMETYKENLKTSVLGRTVLYADVVSSTMDLLEGLHLHLPKEVGLIAIAAQQSKGKGRGRNAWLSPLGCAMFTLSVQVELSSRLGQRIPFLQHLAALAVIEAVRTLPGYQDIDLRVKWPNDIYNSNLVKLGGVLVTSTVMGSTFHLLIGCGFNVTNSNPTSCINDLIQQYNAQHNCNLKLLSGSQLIARTVSCLEALISSFQQGGPDAVLPTYYKRWLHSGSQVSLWSEDGLKAEVVGLDNNGFLQVYSKEQGLASVESDGNSFDMLKNMIVIKQH